MWTEANLPLPDFLEHELRKAGLDRGIYCDRLDTYWANLESPTLLVLACDGGWRNPQKASFRLFRWHPHAPFTEITFGFFGDVPRFDTTTPPGDASYVRVQRAALDAIRDRLGSQTPGL